MFGSRLTAVATWFVLSRLAIFGLGVIGAASFADLRVVADLERGATSTPTRAVMDNVTALNPEHVWQKWDAVWYQHVAEHGYALTPDPLRGQAAAGFFPLYPMTARLVMRVTPALSFFWTATLLSNLMTMAALWLLVTALIDRADQVQRVLAILMTSAGSFYLSIPYAESLFLLLVVGVLVATRRRQYELAGLLAGLSATTRVHGLALVAVPAVACWLDRALIGQTRVVRAAVVVALFAVPIAIYMAHLANVQGSWTAFVSRQELWDNPSPYPLQAIAGFFNFPRRMTGWLHGGFWFLYVGLLIRYWRRMPLGEVLFCAGVLVITTQQEAFHGTYRYIVPLVPLTLALSTDRPEVQNRLIAINIAFGVLMILAFVTWNRIAV
jgi:hypothetical protein